MEISKTYKTALLITGGATAEFRKGLAGTRREVDELSADFKKLQRTTITADRFAAGQTQLTDIKRRYAEVVAAQERARIEMVAGGKGAKAANTEYNRLGTEVDRLRRRLTQKYDALAKDRKALLEDGVATNRLTQEQRRLHVELDKTTARMERLAKTKSAFGEAGEAFHGLGESFRGIFDLKEMALGILGADVAGYSMYEAAKGPVDEIKAASVTSKALNMTVPELQSVRYAAGKYGIEPEALDGILMRMVRTTAEARDATGPAGKDFQRMGLSGMEMSIRTPMEQVMEFARALHDMAPGMRAEIGMRTFGKEQGAAFADMLAAGVAPLKANIQEGRDFRAVDSDEDIEKAKSAARVFDEFNVRMKAFRNMIGMDLVPSVTRGLTRIMGFLESHRGEIEHDIQRFGKLMDGIGPHILSLADSVLTVGERILKLYDSLPGWAKRTLVVGVAVGYLGTKLLSLVGHATTAVYAVAKLGKSLGMWEAELPTIVSLLGRVGPMLRMLSGGVGRLFVAGIEAVGPAIMGVFTAIGTFIAEVAGGIAAVFLTPEVAIGLLVAAVVGAAIYIATHWAGVKRFMVEVFTDPKKAVQDLWDHVQRFFKWIPAHAKEAWHWVTGRLGFGDKPDDSAAATVTGTKSHGLAKPILGDTETVRQAASPPAARFAEPLMGRTPVLQAAQAAVAPTSRENIPPEFSAQLQTVPWSKAQQAAPAQPLPPPSDAAEPPPTPAPVVDQKPAAAPTRPSLTLNFDKLGDIHIHPQPHQNPRDIAAEVAKVLERKQREIMRLGLAATEGYA